jgi:hypothetical protein
MNMAVAGGRPNAVNESRAHALRAARPHRVDDAGEAQAGCERTGVCER